MRQGLPNTQSPEEGVNFKIATVEEADSLFDQAALGQKYQDPEVSMTDSDYGEEEYSSSEEADENKTTKTKFIDQSLKP
jgi:hypothetical protein